MSQYGGGKPGSGAWGRPVGAGDLLHYGDHHLAAQRHLEKESIVREKENAATTVLLVLHHRLKEIVLVLLVVAQGLFPDMTVVLQNLYFLGMWRLFINIRIITLTDVFKVLLLAHGGKQELHKKSFGLMPDGTTDDSHEPIPLIKHLQFLVGVRGKENMAIGGSWSPSLDGEDPTNPATIIRTAIRTTKALTGVDLSDVPQCRRSHLFLFAPQTALRAQLDVKLAAIDTQSVKDDSKEGDSPKPVSKESPVRAPTQAEASTPTKACVLNAVTEETPSKESENEGDVETKEEPTHWSQLDVKSMKVAELRAELEARGLETKGIKTLLAQRLQEAVDKEQEADGTQSRNGEDVEMKDETDIATEKDEEDSATIDAAKEKSEAEVKKEAEELQKKVEKLEKEKKEKKAALERHYTFPKEQKVLVYPSKTAKGGKFDCKLVSLQSLLEYRQDDNKESQFEVSLFAEAFKEMLERHSAFAIYHAISNAADKESERKRRDEARGKKDEEKKEEEKKDGEEKEKKEEEKVELKSLISNRQLFEAFAMYDVNLCGYIAERDLEDILFNSEFGVTRGQVQKLAHKLSSREKINYRHLTDILVDSDGNTKFVPGNCEGAPDVETLMRGYGITYINANEQSSGSNNLKISQSSDSNVIINGNVINVTQKLALLKKSEVERDQAKAALCEQKSLVGKMSTMIFFIVCLFVISVEFDVFRFNICDFSNFVDQLRESKQDLEKKKKILNENWRNVLNDTLY
uniref:SAP domain-containing protein n=1 Tax=Heterorhabditis bacteriophora TaxID=37862 RepID=A0A1I7XK81_HETBA